MIPRCRKERLEARVFLFCLLLSAMRAGATSQQDYLNALVDFERYAETIWHTNTAANKPPDSGYWGDGGSTGNGGIRGNGGVAIAYAVLVNAFPGNSTNAVRLTRIRQALNYAANTHVSGTNQPYYCTDGHKWGWSTNSTDWQTPEWSGSIGLACMLVQANLPAQTISDCQRVIASEADHRSGIAPRSGYISDTAAEENAWDSNVLSLGAAWLNSNTNATNWLTAAKKYLANSYTLANSIGDPLAAWITTTTLYPSCALENHGFFHPTYEMVAGMSMGDSLLMAHLANPTVATQLQAYAEHNVLPVWTNVVSSTLFDSGEFAYPAGLDWELHDYEQNSYITWLATHFNDPLARWADGKLSQLVRARQMVNGDGEFVGPSGGGFYREAVGAKRTAIAWLHWANADFPSGSISNPPPVFKHLPDVDVLVQRSSNSYVSVCYGPQTNGSSPRVMAMIEAPSPVSFPSNVFIASPLQPGVIGMGALGDPTGARLVSVVSNANGFFVELQVTNGGNGTTEVYLNSTGESVGIVEIPFPIIGFNSTAASSFDTGIENDQLTGGSRLLEWTGSSATISNRTGATRNITNAWVCVSGRYGLAAGPNGYFDYQAASSYNRLGAAQDTLAFFPQDPAAGRYAVYFPGQSAAQTASKAALINWTVTSSNCILNFPGATGSVVQIIASLPPPPPPYQPYALSIASVSASSSQSGFPPTNAVNANYTDFWVSSGTSAGQGPTTNDPEWLLVNFPRRTAVSRFQVYPRTTNGGYGPKNVSMLLNGVSVYQGVMGATTTLDVSLSPPVYATNAQLWITSSYDAGSPGNPRNVQVVEMVFFERALPATFGDWALRQFNDAQLADASISGVMADPDGDGAPNLLEFAMGGTPLTPDGSNFKLQSVSASASQFTFRFRQAKDLAGVARQFQQSTNLGLWTTVAPLNVSTAQDSGTVQMLQATFAALAKQSFFRVNFSQ
ncbi:MAG TPA: discoidin domain-containing protein [Candidatus Dormibacteraeota bacterium]|nr:discoidin domain-containing protein [Candidatus Dormibacteraeota bacterium]